MLHWFYDHRMVFNFSYEEGNPTPISILWQSALVQLIIQLIVNFISSVIETELKIPNIKVWKQERWVLPPPFFL